jgi:hypothetical protein
MEEAMKIKRKERRQQYVEKNADKIRAKKMKKYVCYCCDKVLNYDHKSRHIATKKHQKNEKLIEQNSSSIVAE